MNHTTNQAESFVWAESPLISSRCPKCAALVKHSIDDGNQPLFLSYPYRIRTIKILGGRCFEKVDRTFLHVCGASVAPSGNGVGCVL